MFWILLSALGIKGKDGRVDIWGCIIYVLVWLLIGYFLFDYLPMTIHW